jgi:hypothetical protein
MIKMKRMGDVMFDIEEVIGKQMIEKHDLQKGEALSLINDYIDVHYPGAIEEYQDGTNPIYFYGPLETFVKLHSKRIREILDEVN